MKKKIEGIILNLEAKGIILIKNIYIRIVMSKIIRVPKIM